MDDLVRRKDLVEVMGNCMESWGAGLEKELRRDWGLAVKIKDNFLRAIEKLECVPVASKEALVAALDLKVEDDWYTNDEIAEHLMDCCAMFATNHVPVERKVRSECPSPDYCKGWNDAVQRMEVSYMQAMPCKVGDKLWWNFGADMPIDMIVQEIRFQKDGCLISLESGTLAAEIMAEDIGKTAFFTEQEAVAAIEESVRALDEVLDEAAIKREGMSKGEQKDRVSRELNDNVWFDVDASGRDTDEYLDEMMF